MSSDLQRQANVPKTIGDLAAHKGFQEQLAEVLPKHVSADRMSRLILGAIRKTPKLENCTLPSFANACRQLSAWGLEPDGYHAHLIPYGRECTLVLDYKGIVNLAYQSGLVRSIHADVVHAGDKFVYRMGEVQDHVRFDFRPESERNGAVRGEIIAAYAIVKLVSGAEKHEVMTRSEVDAIRAASKAGRSGPWVTHYSEMAKKTVFRRCSKWLPLSAEVVNAFQVDADTPDFTSQTVASAATGGVEGLRDRLIASDDKADVVDADTAEPHSERPEAPSDDAGEPSAEELAASGQGQLIPDAHGDDGPNYD